MERAHNTYHNTYRTQKDYDIARMSSLKAAVELIAAFKDNIETGEKIVTTTIKAAEQFYSWILSGHEEAEQREEQDSNYLRMVMAEIHNLQDKLNLKRTDFEADPCPWADSWSQGGAAMLLENLRDRAKNGSKAGSNAGDVESNGYKHNSIHGAEYRQGEYPISKKQFGFLVGLHKKLKLEYDKAALNALTSREASARIDELQAQLGETGNGNGKQTMTNLTGQIRERGIR